MDELHEQLSERPVAAIERDEAATIVRLAGELDLYNAAELRTALLGVCAEAPTRLVVDLGSVAFVDSTALGVLIEARGHMADQSAFLLAAPGVETVRALEISGIDRLLRVHPSVEAALASPLQ